MRNKILNYLKSDRSFESGLTLYIAYGESQSFKRILNRQGNSEYNYKLLLEQLRKTASIHTDQFNFIMSQAIVLASPEQVIENNKPVTPEEITEFIDEFPAYVKKSIKLREEFPFLREKSCPDELKLLVADMMTAYEIYMKAHERLFSALSPDDFKDATEDLVENYLVNRLIWDELNYYKENKIMLGKHPIFSQMERFKEIRSMKGDKLVKLLKSLENNIARNKKNIADLPYHPETQKRKERVDAYIIELAEVKRLIETR